jgi:hypothetical protein
MNGNGRTNNCFSYFIKFSHYLCGLRHSAPSSWPRGTLCGEYILAVPVADQMLGKLTKIVCHISRCAEILKAAKKDNPLIQV